MAVNSLPPILTVSDLNRQARVLLEQNFNLIWVQGEISNFSQPGSGHWYFTLKDAGAQLRCAMFVNRNRAVRPTPKNGQEVVVRGRVSLYENRGEYQMIVDALQAQGEGALRAAYDALRLRLSEEGLFDASRKLRLPEMPRRLVVISSISGAALRDVLSVLTRRYPVLEVILIPVAVQGENAEHQVIDALRRAPAQDPDVILLTRGGGSLEDLWTFNLESVVRAVVACPIPVVSAIGHETDVTICDFAADLRSPTPSAAAEMISPDVVDLSHRFSLARRSLMRVLNSDLGVKRHRLLAARARLTDPRARLIAQMQRADDLDMRLKRAMHARLEQARHDYLLVSQRLRASGPQRHFLAAGAAVNQLRVQLRNSVQRALSQRRLRLLSLQRTLTAVSPQATLDRGYAILLKDQMPVTSVAQVAAGDGLRAYVHDGQLDVTVNAASLISLPFSARRPDQ